MILYFTPVFGVCQEVPVNFVSYNKALKTVKGLFAHFDSGFRRMGDYVTIILPNTGNLRKICSLPDGGYSHFYRKFVTLSVYTSKNR